MPHDGKQVANHIVEVASRAGRPMDIMTLLKLSYFTHGWCLARHDRPLVTDYVEAWKYGPVIPSVYYSFRRQGIYGLRQLNLIREDLDDHELQTISDVYESYGNLSAVKMSRLTHKRGGPWHQIYHSQGSGSPIPNDLIKAYYTGDGDGHARAINP